MKSCQSSFVIPDLVPLYLCCCGGGGCIVSTSFGDESRTVLVTATWELKMGQVCVLSNGAQNLCLPGKFICEFWLHMWICCIFCLRVASRIHKRGYYGQLVQVTCLVISPLKSNFRFMQFWCFSWVDLRLPFLFWSYLDMPITFYNHLVSQWLKDFGYTIKRKKKVHA